MRVAGSGDYTDTPIGRVPPADALDTEGLDLSSDDLAKARSFGIRGLHERAGTVGGWVELSCSGSGTTMILSVPLNPLGIAGMPYEAQLGDPDDPSQWGHL